MKREDLYVYHYADTEFYLTREANSVIDDLEKRIKELEAKAAEDYISYQRKTQNQAKRIAELEAENAELKKQVPVWHSVAEGDLPSNGRDVLAFTGFYHHIDNYHGFYMNEHHWRVYDDETHWCELPKAPAKKENG